jgi:hypothetical protein
MRNDLNIIRNNKEDKNKSTFYHKKILLLLFFSFILSIYLGFFLNSKDFFVFIFRIFIEGGYFNVFIVSII